MPPRLTLEERLRNVGRLREEPDLERLRAGLTKALGDGSNLVVAEAAKIVAELELARFDEPLLDAWRRLLIDPVKADKGCAGKAAIVEALGRTGFDDVDFWLEGIRYVQMEPAWGGSADAAGLVRGGCAFGLARSHGLGPARKMTALVDLLCRSEPADRVHAAQAIADIGNDAAIPLLKFVLLKGDKPEVVGACFGGLLRLAPGEFLPVVVRHLDASSDDLVIEAAAALGEHGRPEALAALIAKAKRTSDAELLAAIHGSIGLIRHSDAVEFLLSRVAAGGRDAVAAVRALRPACLHAETRRRVVEAAEATKDRKVIAAAAGLGQK